MSDGDDLDVHLGRLAQWMLQRIGSAILFATSVAILASGLAGVIGGEPWFVAGVGSLAWLASFGTSLSSAKAPLPSDGR